MFNFDFKKTPDMKTLPSTKDNEDVAVDDPCPINSKIKINNILDDLNNIQPDHSEIALDDSFQLGLGDLETGST